MQNRDKVLGIRRKTVEFFHKVMLLIMLHSTLVAPSQSLILDFHRIKGIEYNIKNVPFSNPKKLSDLFLRNQGLSNLRRINEINDTGLIPKRENMVGYSIHADIKEGFVGLNAKNPFDDAKDNLFKFFIKGKEFKDYKVFLTYELYGVQDFNAVSRSINERPATGGYIVKSQSLWSLQREEINSNWLKEGENKVFFSVPKGAHYQYKIKNVKLEFEKASKSSLFPTLIVNNTIISYQKDNQFYIKGFLKNYRANSYVYIEDSAIAIIDGEYEGFVKITDDIKKRGFVIIKAADDKGIIAQEILPFSNFIEADKAYEIEANFKPEVKYVEAKKGLTIKTDGASLRINDSSLTESKEIIISKIRKIDIAPMSSGLVNVTKGGYAYRFLPDGTKFKNPVKIEIEYDDRLIPKGHNENDIKTFYFDTKLKTWIPIERDNINLENKSITSLTNHFTDYINGIIQAPESPETAGFTPTMMNDIKAVDPSSEMTLISPPEVSQKGDANISYPIKIPSGRKGVQPQIVLQYSSEGQNGWIGQGWNINMPSLSINTKWGVPLFDPNNESEMYILNGQELMYPKYHGQDWMPNRHRDSVGIYNTTPISRVANLQFSTRKQSSFAKIERLGNSTNNYFWKVTNIDGSINWYGGKNVVVPNAVIKNANNDIVHWALYMTEDIYGNCVKYEYENTVIPNQSGNNANLNGGIIFHIKSIKYNGFNDTDYKYEILFYSTNTIREDVSINARLGVKQIEPYFLNNISVKKVGTVEPIRTYKLSIGYGKFKKGQLRAVTELDKDGTVFYKHSFDYYDDITQDSQEIYFSSAVTETVCNDVAEPCQDTDNDGVCDQNDPCPQIASSQINNNSSCNKCYQIQFPNPLPSFNQNTMVYLNGSLYACNPPTSFNEFFSSFQHLYPSAILTNNSLGTLLTISNTCENMYGLTIISTNENPSYEPWSGQFIEIGCNSGNKTIDLNTTRELSNENSYTFNGTIPINSNTECPSFLNYDFLFPEIIPSFDSSLSLLGSSTTKSDNSSLYVGVGIGCKWYTKSTTFGKQWTWSKDKTESKTALVDINGDGLLDVVIKENGFLYYKPHQTTITYGVDNEVEVAHDFGAKRPINGINSFYNANGSSKSGNFQITYGVKKVGGFLGKDKQNSESETNVYFTDGNGDGLMDIVKNGVVYFNHLDVNNNPSFTVNSMITENMVIKAQSMTIDEPDFDETSNITIPAYDVVKVWEAPATGQIVIDNDIQLIDLNKEAVVTIEKKNVSVVLTPVINVSPNILNDMSYTGLGPSSTKTFSVSGQYLQNNILVSAPVNYEISFSQNSGFTNSLSLTPVSGGVNATTIYVRLKAGLPIQVYNNKIITLISTGAINKTVVCNGEVTYVCPQEGFDGFDNGTIPLGWTMNLSSPIPFSTTSGQFGLNSPSVKFSNTGDQIVTVYQSNNTNASLSFWFKGINANGSSLLIEFLDQNNTWQVLENITNIPSSGTIKNYSGGSNPAISINNKQFRFTYTKVSGDVLIDDIYINCNCDLCRDSEEEIYSSIEDNHSVNPINCVETPDELCLLFGANLNNNNPSISSVVNLNCNGQPLSVVKGDRIYFRLHSIDSGNSDVNWNPKVTYVESVMANTIDQNGLKPFESSYSDGFILSKFQPTSFPGNSGTATITWDSFNVHPSDDLKFEIFKRQTIAQEDSDDDSVSGTTTPIFSLICPANQTTQVSPSLALSGITMPSIIGNDEPLINNDFYFKVSSSSNVKWKQFEWKPKMICSVQTQVIGENGPEGTLTSNTTMYPIVDYSIYKSYPCSPSYSLYNTSSLPSNSNLRIKPYLNNLFDIDDHDGVLWFVVKKDGNLIGKRQISITHQTFLGNEYLDVSYVGDDTAINIAGLNGNIEIGFYTDESNLYDGQTSLLSKLALANTSVRVYYGGSGVIDVPNSKVNLFQRPNPKFGPMLQQWGQFMYNPDFVSGAPSSTYGSLIKEEYLIFSESNATNIQDAINNLPSENVSAEAAEDALDNFETFNNTLLNYNSAFLISTPNKENNQQGILQDRWIGLNKENYSSEFSSRAATLEQSFNSFFDGQEYEFQSVLETGAFGINKKSKGSSKNISGGFSVDIAVSVGANASKTLSGNNTVKTDYIDFNGDRYPDIITNTKRQYTSKTGGLNQPENKTTEISKSKSSGWGIGAQASFGKGGDEGGGTKGNGDQLVRFEGFRGNSGGPVSGNFSKGLSITDSFWLDINSDGLADFIRKDTDGNVMVNLNFGYNQESEYIWNLDNLFNSKSNNISAGTGFNKWNGSAEWGISLTSAWNNTSNTLIDMNGDGLVDYVNTDEDIKVTLNTGNKFYQNSYQWSSENLKKESVTVGATSNLGATAALIWPFFWGLCLKAPAVSVSKSIISTTTNKTKKTITDFDGDGYPDLVEQAGFNTIKIYHSRIRRTDKLKSVTNPLGGKFTIDYKVQPLDYNNPQPRWTMSEVTIEDGYDKINDGKDVYKKQFIYENGKYDRREREFYGYKTVKTEEYTTDSSGNPQLYRTSISNFHNQSYFLNGLLEDSYVIKGSDINMKFSRTKNFYEIYKLNNNNDEIDFSMVQPNNYDVGGTEGRKSAIVLLTKTVNELYELSPSPQLVTEVNFKYDEKGRIIEFINKGNVNNVNDDYTSSISYHNLTPGINIINIPESIKVTTPNGGLMRHRKTEVDSSNGNITGVFAYNNGNWLQTSMEYDGFGNLIHIKYPHNSNGESMDYDYAYDTVYNKYIVSIKDAFGYTSSASYNSDFDKIVETVDKTGNKMIYKYDSFGRNVSIISPKEIEAGVPYTIKFEYYPYFSLLPSGSGVSYDPLDPVNSTFVPVAVTKHYDQQHPTNDIETYTFIDGLARPIQVKKDVWLNMNDNPQSPDFSEGLSISGKTSYDELGRATQQFHPWWETKSNSTKFLLNEHLSPFVATTNFDEIDRPIKTIDPEGNVSLMQYSLDTDVSGTMAIKTKSDVDQNGSQHIVTETFKDVYGRVISVKNEGGNSGAIWTKFEYNEIGELLSYTDAESISTTYKYDMLGRKIMVKHPDNGITVFNYDDVNLISLETANLQSSGGLIKYKYEFNRLINIEYPNTPNGNPNLANVTYKYGDTGNQTGRLIYQEDATGIQVFDYGNMGEMTNNTRTVVGPNIPTREFKTKFGYDSWNRLQFMIYPDGEKVSYQYDLGGNLKQITGEYNGDPYNYVERIDYDHYEQKRYLLYGNKTETYYNYSPALRRLDNLNVKTSDNNDLFFNKYDYDKVGNVLKISNSAGVSANNMAGQYGHSFEYDNLNRLIAAEGSFDGSSTQIASGNDANAGYFIKMEYNDTHGINYKQQEHIKNGNVFTQNTYKNVYSYVANTHKLETVIDDSTGEVEEFSYDLNGNITKRVTNATQKVFSWDESNRLRVVSDDISMQHYIYDASGERVLKANSDVEAVYENGTLVNSPGTVSINGYTSYPSAFMVITADGVYSKHYYAGNQRIVSRLGNDSASIFETGCPTCKETSGSNNLDDVKLKMKQKADLQGYADKLKKGTISYKDFKPIPLSEQEKAIIEEDDAYDLSSKTKSNNEIEALPSPIYFYHPDHLGTSTALTDFNGNAYQFFLNLPFGETMAQQLGSNYYNSPYKFNGKELDEETGLYYYGARYYDPRISIFQSVDQMTEKYPGVNPYVYCFQNPINLIDPTGMEPDDPPTTVYLVRKNEASQDGGYHATKVAQTNGEGSNRNIWTVVGEDGTNKNYIGDNAIIDMEKDGIKIESIDYGNGSTIDSVNEACSDFVSSDEYRTKQARETMRDYIIGILSFPIFAGLGGALRALTYSDEAVVAAETSTSKLPTQIHHFATNKNSVFTKQMNAIAQRYGLDLNGAWNKAAMPHLGRHPNEYHNFVLQGMERASMEAGSSQAKFLQLFDQYVKQPVLQNPNLLRKSGW